MLFNCTIGKPSGKWQWYEETIAMRGFKSVWYIYSTFDIWAVQFVPLEQSMINSTLINWTVAWIIMIKIVSCKNYIFKNFKNMNKYSGKEVSWSQKHTKYHKMNLEGNATISKALIWSELNIKIFDQCLGWGRVVGEAARSRRKRWPSSLAQVKQNQQLLRSYVCCKFCPKLHIYANYSFLPWL